MKAIINGKTYNTETATELCSLPCSAQGRGDFNWHSTGLYRTKKGGFFIAGEGGPASMWSRSAGQNSYTGGSGVRVVDAVVARGYMEAADCDEDDFVTAGLAVEEA